MQLVVFYQLPGSARMGSQMYVKHLEKGDEQRQPLRPSSAIDVMGTKTTLLAEFGDSEVTFTIKQIPGPDRINPYQVVISDPFEEDLSGTADGTHYEIKWVHSTTNPASTTSAGASLPTPDPNVPSGEPLVSSVRLSATELMMLPHDPRLAFEVEHYTVSGSEEWISFTASDPAGAIIQYFRIQTLSDPGGLLGTAGLAESELRAVCAPYLPNSLEKRCEVQTLKRPSGDISYCLLTKVEMAGMPPALSSPLRGLFVGVFRVGSSVAVVIGNFSQKDDTNFRLMLETLGKIYALPVVPAPATAFIRRKGCDNFQ